MLTEEELKALSDDFTQFLVVQGVDDDTWRKMNIENEEKAIEVVKEKYEKIIIVFGAGGNRDSYKRVNMGKAANKADQIIITNDNPRKEDPMTIAKEILEGVGLNKKVEIVLDRKAALKKGLDSLLGKSVLLVLGKGHESKQELNEGFVDFDDSVMISNLIKDMK